jgi:hypothetical protein
LARNYAQRNSDDPDPEDEQAIEDFNRDLYSILTAPLPKDQRTGEWKPRVLQFSEEAKQIYKDRYEDNQQHLGPDGKYFPVAGFVGKSLEQAARVAANLQAFYEPAATHIHPDVASMALEIMDYYIDQQLNNEGAINDPAIVKAHSLYKFLCEHSEYEHVNLRYLVQKGPGPLRSTEKMEPVIKTLEEFGLLQDAGSGHHIDGYGIARKAWKVHRGFQT